MTTPNTKEVATARDKPMVDLVTSRVEALVKMGRLAFPPNYHPGNALMAAWLKIQGTVDKEKKPALTVCSRDSIQLALLDMVVLGLTPAKDQCYFVVYGGKLTLMRSYFGTVAVCMRVTKALDAWAYPVYQDDDFEYEIQGKRIKVTKHVQKLANVKADKIVAAYAALELEEGKAPVYELMTMEQIKQAWRMNRFYKPDDADDAHNRFPDMMARKTVLSRLAKQYVNRSSDDSLLLEAFNRVDDELHEETVQTEIDANANKLELPEASKEELGGADATQATLKNALPTPACFQVK
jgi:recombination protein RecT